MASQALTLAMSDPAASVPIPAPALSTHLTSQKSLILTKKYFTEVIFPLLKPPGAVVVLIYKLK